MAAATTPPGGRPATAARGRAAVAGARCAAQPLRAAAGRSRLTTGPAGGGGSSPSLPLAVDNRSRCCGCYRGSLTAHVPLHLYLHDRYEGQPFPPSPPPLAAGGLSPSPPAVAAAAFLFLPSPGRRMQPPSPPPPPGMGVWCCTSSTHQRLLPRADVAASMGSHREGGGWRRGPRTAAGGGIDAAPVAGWASCTATGGGESFRAGG